MATQVLSSTEPHTADPFPINGTDFVEFYVGNAKQASHYYRAAFGFQLVGYRGPETGVRDRASYLLVQDKVRFVLTSALGPDSPIAEHHKRHGDGVKDLALWVDDCRASFAYATAHGAVAVQEPTVLKDEHGEVVIAAIRTYGDTIHSLVERRNYAGLFLPGFRPVQSRFQPAGVGLKYVDHCVGNVELGKMNEWVRFYEETLGFSMFKHFDDKDISTEYSALMSKVMASGNNLIKIPINEPAAGKKKSQVQEYLDWHNNTPGVQHLALRTDDELHSIAELRRRGVDFLMLPDTYYELVWDRVDGMLRQHGHKPVREDHEAVKKLGILVDADDEGYLLQLFTKPLQDRPTLFFEIICRRGSQSFGKGNFKALFEALEIEQGKRGNL